MRIRPANVTEIKAGGLILGMDRKCRRVYYNAEDTHAFILGATRSGKSRCLVLPSIGLIGMSGESMVVVDVKGELYGYTYPYLESCNYEIIRLDFSNPRKTMQYNFLQMVIDACNEGDIPKAVTKARDVATLLIQGGEHTEPVWIDGARAITMMGILAVVMDNQNRPRYQNLANVRQFIATMCTPVGEKHKLPLEQYLDQFDEDSPLKNAMAIAQITPSKMRGSFYSQALTALEMFTDPYMHEMTAETSWEPEAMGRRRQAVFIVLPDERKTYHSLAALFVMQQYQRLVEQATGRGGRLKNRVHFVCDEFGNFVKIPDMSTILTVSGGRGIRFYLFLQDTNQLDELYGDKVGRTIRANCETWVYLQTDDGNTLKELSEKLGNYTIKAPGISGSSRGDATASYNLTGRPLLMPEEIKRLKRPYQLVTSRAAPAIHYMPDISKTVFNRLFGMGEPEHNRKLLLRRLKHGDDLVPKPQYAIQDWQMFVDMALVSQ